LALHVVSHARNNQVAFRSKPRHQMEAGLAGLVENNPCPEIIFWHGTALARIRSATSWLPPAARPQRSLPV
jgi:hypothetical protein